MRAAEARRLERRRTGTTRRAATLFLAAGILWPLGCAAINSRTDRDMAALIRARQRDALGREAAAAIDTPARMDRPGRAAYEPIPDASTDEMPPGFDAPADATSIDISLSPTSQPTDAVGRGEVFTLTDSLSYAQRHRREYQTAKETLYFAALSLTLERHLWTPIFSSQVRTVYANYGEEQHFDQAMKAVADLGVSQRLPYGGEFTAKAIAELVRDVGRSITASEDSSIQLGLRVPLLRGAGHVAREDLIQLERELTYAVRTFERFRRQQLVSVARSYFDLLRAKQAVIDSERSLETARDDYKRAEANEAVGKASALDTQRAELRRLSAENAVAQARETFRSTADGFKLEIGMPLESPLIMDDLEDIETIERRTEAGDYPLLAPSRATGDDHLAVDVALERRLDLLTLANRIDDARRGVEISRNAMLPSLDWDSSLSFATDSNHYNMGAHHFDRAQWRTELTLDLPVERTAERHDLRRSMIRVRAAQRDLLEQQERVRVEVRGIVNRIRLQERVVAIQERTVEVAEQQREYAQIRFEDGEIDNRDKIQAEEELLAARNRLNEAKTRRWTLLLEFRLATETLRVEEDGSQVGE